MKKLITICAVVALVLAVSGLVQAGTIASDPDYKASTDLSIGAWHTIRAGTDYELEGFGISAEFQINLLYQAGILDEDIDALNHYWQPMNSTYNFPDPEEYVLNVSATGGLTIYEFDELLETTGGTNIKWTLTAWHQTILAGDIIDNGDGTITLQVLPVGTYRPFVGDPPVNNVEVFDGDLDCEVLGYTFTGEISGIGNGSVLSVNLAPAPTEVWVDDDFDNSTLGWGTTHFATIQDGVDAVASDGTVNVAAGTYDEQVVIDKSLTLQGDGDTTIIQPSGPGLLTTTSIPWINGGTSTMATIVSVETLGDTVNIKNLKIDGSLITSKSTTWIAGLVYLETNGTIDSVTVIGNPTLPDRTAGIFASAISNTANVEVTECTVEVYTRAGIYALGDTMTADYHHNVINGPGSILAGVPNGMFFLEGAMGSATYNIITDLSYTGDPIYRSTGIGTYNAGADIVFSNNEISYVQNAFALAKDTSGTTVEHNNIHDSHTGVKLESGATNSIIQYNDIMDNDFAIRGGADMGDGNVAHYNNFIRNIGAEEIVGGDTYIGAVSNIHATYILDAECNWWGHESGPSVYGPGSGDAVSDNVSFDPWLEAEVGAMSYFHVKKFELKTAKGEVKFEAEFMLGNCNDLDLENDDTTLVVTDPATEVLDITIPAGSWAYKLDKKSGLVKEYKAKIEEDDVKMEVKLKPDKKNPDKWKFSFKGKNMTISAPIGAVVDATLTIGGDIGSETDVPVKVKK